MVCFQKQDMKVFSIPGKGPQTESKGLGTNKSAFPEGRKRLKKKVCTTESIVFQFDTGAYFKW